MLSLIKLDKLSKMQTEANELLRQAVISDRGRSWNKMAENYKKLLKLVAKSNLPSSFAAPPSYDMLLYESFYHFGVALQNLGRHRESVFAYTSAMNAMHLRKNGCLAGCHSNTCFQTPVLARRGFAFARSGDVKSAFKDVEKAVILDAKNPDLYCLRALLWNMKKEQRKAIEDLDSALKYNEFHVGALLLRGTIDQPIQLGFRLLQGISQNAKKETPKDHQLAIKINSDASCFTDMGDIHHPKMVDFWNKFLRCLNIPRTVIHVDLVSAVIAQYNTTLTMYEDTRELDPKSTAATPLTQQRPRSTKAPVISKSPTLSRPKSLPATPFRCGTPYHSESSQSGHEARTRRLTYGQALRTYTVKKQENGVSEYIQRLVEHASRPSTAKKKTYSEKIPSITIKPPPAPSRPSSRKSSLTSSSKMTQSLSVSSTPHYHLHAPTIHPPTTRRGSHISVASCPIPFNRTPSHRNGDSQASLFVASPAQRRASVAGLQPNHKQAAEFASAIHGVEVYREVNLSDAPRMYYKPWGGDKLPVAELPTRPKLDAFRV